MVKGTRYEPSSAKYSLSVNFVLVTLTHCASIFSFVEIKVTTYITGLLCKSIHIKLLTAV